jgi:hypothetical protein
MALQRLHLQDLEPSVLQAYLQGALHDGTRSRLHATHRFAQKGAEWLGRLATILTALGHRSWIYREGRNRTVFSLETSATFLDVTFDPDRLSSQPEQVAYVRGYFDAEGGVPRSPTHRFYVQLTQKNRVELGKVKAILEGLGVTCGKMHNPSVRIDPHYWRFFVRTRSHVAFASRIGSWHPIKERILQRKLIELAPASDECQTWTPPH